MPENHNLCTPRILKGFRDIFSHEYQARRWLISTVEKVYERYGFAPIETPALEYVDVLGKYLPECDTAEEGIFAFRDRDKEWIALRYDLTAPLSRVVSLYPELPRPFRRYQLGVVWRDEKPGLGRFREFYQLDIDTVGSASMQADAEVCCVICDVMEALGIAIGEFMVKVSNRKILNGILEKAGIAAVNEKGELTPIAMTTLRAVDKLDRLGMPGVIELLGPGRKDESGDFTKGAGLTPPQIDMIVNFLNLNIPQRENFLQELRKLVGDTKSGQEGIQELTDMDNLLRAVGYLDDRVMFDATIVRGLSYYTGPVFETVLTKPYRDEKGNERFFGSVFSGGRYDGLVERFLGQKVPATGASIGVDRILEAMKCFGKIKMPKATSQVLVTTMDANLTAEYQKLVFELRRAGIRAEVYLDKGGLKKQLKYADAWDIPLAVIVGSDEIAKQQVTIKDLQRGRQLAQEIKDREEWRKGQPAQVTVARDQMLSTIQQMLGN